MVALLETQDLAVSEHGAIVADDPKLKVNVHGRRHAGVFRKLQGIQPPNYPPSPTQATNLPRFLVLSRTGDFDVGLILLANHLRQIETEQPGELLLA